MRKISMIYDFTTNTYKDSSGVYMLRLIVLPSNAERYDTRWELLRLEDGSIIDFDEHVGDLAESWGMELVLDDV